MNQSARKLSIATTFAAGLLAAQSGAAPAWSVADSGIGAVKIVGSRVALAGIVADSVWLKILESDGATRSVQGWKLGPCKVVPHLSLLAEGPGRGWVVGVDTSSTATSAWIARLDSNGNAIGNPTTFAHDTALSLTSAVFGKEVRVAPLTGKMTDATLYQLDSLNGLVDSSSKIPAWGTLKEIQNVSGKVLYREDWVFNSGDAIHYDLIGRTGAYGKSQVSVVGYDSLLNTSSTTKAFVLKDSTGVDNFVQLTDSGAYDAAKGIVPRARIVAWRVLGDSMARRFDVRTDLLVAAQRAWWTKGGLLRVVGAAKVSGGGSAFRPAVIDLDTNGKVVASRTYLPGGKTTVFANNIVAGNFLDGTGFVGIRQSDNQTVEFALLGASGDSAGVLEAVAGSTTNLWYAVGNDVLLSTSIGLSGGRLAVDSWNASPATSVIPRILGCDALRATGDGLALDLSEPVRSARLEIRDPVGKLLEIRQLGSLAAGRHNIPVARQGVSLCRVTSEHSILVARVAAPQAGM